MDIIDFYYILSISPNATLEEIRRAYRRLAFLYHPDLSKSPDSTRIMQQLNEAYSVLGNPVRRAQYDFWRRYTEQSFRRSRSPDRQRPVVFVPQIGVSQTISIQKSRHERLLHLWLGLGQFIYRIIFYGMLFLLALVLYLVPPILYFFIFGLFFNQVAPSIPMKSEDALGWTLMTAMILGMLTPRFLKRVPALNRLYRMLGYK
jgi:DnaJ domain